MFFSIDPPLLLAHRVAATEARGLVVLGTPLGTDAFVQRQLELKRVEHDRLLTCIPAIADLQAA